MKTEDNQHEMESDGFRSKPSRRHYVSAVDDGEHDELEGQATSGNLSRVFTFLLLLHVFLIGSVVLYNVISEKPRMTDAGTTQTSKPKAIEQKSDTPPPVVQNTPTQPAPQPKEMAEHIVTSGQNLQNIADITGATTDEIVQLNRLNENGELYVGRKLIVPKRSSESAPAPAAVSQQPAQVEQKNIAAKTESVKKDSPPAPAPAPKSETTPSTPPAALDKPAQKRPETVAQNDPPKPKAEAPKTPAPKLDTPAKPKPTSSKAGGSHEVKAGETFYSISRKYDVNVNELMKLNNVSDPGKLRKGTVLRIPAK